MISKVKKVLRKYYLGWGPAMPSTCFERTSEIERERENPFFSFSEVGDLELQSHSFLLTPSHVTFAVKIRKRTCQSSIPIYTYDSIRGCINRNTHLSLGNSHFGSSGNSYSETPASMGVSAVEDRRVVILTSGVLEFMEELDSAETWIQNAKPQM